MDTKHRSKNKEKPIYIRLKDRPPSERPRERLWQLGADKLSNAELLAILIRKGTEGRSAIQVAEELIGKSGAIQELAKLTPSEIKQTKGMGTANVAALSAAFELSRRLNIKHRSAKTYLKTVQDVVDYFREHYGAGSPEKFVAFFINRNHALLGELEVSRGGSNAVVVDPQRIFKEALLCDAKAVILTHNHPGGETNPSKYDLELTKELKAAGDLFRIPVIEHVIATERDYSSFVELDLFD